MATVHGYFAIEALPATTTAQIGTLRDALRPLAANTHAQPARRFHYRTRLDNRAIIFEGQFDTAHLTAQAVRDWLAGVFGIQADSIDVDIAPGSTYVVTYSRNGTEYLRYAMFGYDGEWPTWDASRAAVESYIANNRIRWEPSAL